MSKKQYEATCYINGSKKSQKISVYAIDKEDALSRAYCKLYTDRKNKEFKITAIKAI